MTTRLDQTINHEIMEPRILGEDVYYSEKPVTTHIYRCDGCGLLWNKRWYADTCGERKHISVWAQTYWHRAPGFQTTGKVEPVHYPREAVGRDKRVARADFAVEASDLGFAPGVWPASFERDGVTYHATSRRVENGELVAVIYRSTPDSLAKVSVLND